MQTKQTIAFLSIFFLSGCGIFSKNTKLQPPLNEEKVEELSQEASTKTSVANEDENNLQIELEAQNEKNNKLINILNSASESKDYKLCQKIEDEQLKRDCEDQVTLTLIGDKQNRKLCDKLHASDLKMICESGFKN